MKQPKTEREMLERIAKHWASDREIDYKTTKSEDLFNFIMDSLKPFKLGPFEVLANVRGYMVAKRKGCAPFLMKSNKLIAEAKRRATV